MRKLTVLAVLMLSLVIGLLPAKAQGATIADTVVALATAENKEFSILLDAVLAADPSILAALSDPSASLTVFAPTDNAFLVLLDSLDLTAAELLANKTLLNNVLLYHVVAGAVPAATVLTLENKTFVPTLLTNDDLLVSFAGGSIYVDSSRVIGVDVNASNGVIHVIDSVLVPDRVNGENATARNLSNIAARIDTKELLFRSIVNVVVGNAQNPDAPQFTILLAAIQAADPSILVALDDPNGNLTVFAPTDAAFLAAFKALGVTPEQVLADQAALTDILLYHVVAGRVLSSQLVTGEVTALNGDALDIRVGGGVRVNNARVVTANIAVANGVIHVIDAVLLPPSN